MQERIIKNANKSTNLTWCTNNVLATSTSRGEESSVDLQDYILHITDYKIERSDF